jgi:hypothetical protein
MTTDRVVGRSGLLSRSGVDGRGRDPRFTRDPVPAVTGHRVEEATGPALTGWLVNGPTPALTATTETAL